MPKPSNINTDLEKLLKSMLHEAAKKETDIALEDKLKIIDRALKLEALKHKIEDDGYGKDFDLGGEDG
jgi:hypothetical protein